MKLWKKILTFFVSFLIYHIIFSDFFPVDENNVLQVPGWYILTGTGISLLITALIVFRKKVRMALSAYMKKRAERKKYESLSEAEKYKLEKFMRNNSEQAKSFASETMSGAARENSIAYHTLSGIKNMTVEDELLPAAVDIVLETGMASASMLQRRLCLGYTRAARILDEMEKNGIVGAYNGSKPRSIMITKEQWANTTVNILSGLQKASEKTVSNDPATPSYGHDVLASIDSMEGHAFEHWCAELLRKHGFQNVSVTPGSGDQGADILAEKDGIRYAIQCKCYSKDLGNTPIQEVEAGRTFYGCHVGAVMTNRYFTAGAKELAKKTGTLLWDRDWIVNATLLIRSSPPEFQKHSFSEEDNKQSIFDYSAHPQNEYLQKPGRTAAVVFQRHPRFLMCAAPYWIEIDGTILGKIGNGEKITIYIREGGHNVTVRNENLPWKKVVASGFFTIIDRAQFEIETIGMSHVVLTQS